MYQSRVVVASFQTVNCFFVHVHVLVTRLGEALDGAPGRPLLYGHLQGDKFFRIGEAFLTVDRTHGIVPLRNVASAAPRH